MTEAMQAGPWLRALAKFESALAALDSHSEATDHPPTSEGPT